MVSVQKAAYTGGPPALRSSTVPTWMNGERLAIPGPCVPIHVLECASPDPDIRGTAHIAPTDLTGPSHT